MLGERIGGASDSASALSYSSSVMIYGTLASAASFSLFSLKTAITDNLQQNTDSLKTLSHDTLR